MASSRAEIASGRSKRWINLGGGTAPLEGRWSSGQVGPGADGFYESRSCPFFGCCMAPDHGAHWQTTEEIRVHDGDETYFEHEVEKFVREFCPHDTDPTDAEVKQAAAALKDLDATSFVQSLLDITLHEARERIMEVAHHADEADLIDNKHFILTAFHDRDDIYYGAANNENYLSTFVSSLLMEKYSLPGDDIPAHVPIKSMLEFHSIVSSVTPESGGKFNLKNPEIQQQVYDRVREIDWATARASVYAICPWPNGVVNSPAWNSLWVIRAPPKEGESIGEMLMWNFVSANANGDASTQYIGTTFDDWYESWPGFRFTPLSRADNIYRFRLTKNPLKFTIQAYYKDYPPNVPLSENWSGSGEFDGKGNRPYIQIHNVITPALKETVEEFMAEEAPSVEKTRQMLVKGCLMYDLMRLYEPGKSDSKLFSKVALGDASAPEAIAVGGIMNLFSDYSNWRGALWVVPPDKEVMDEDAHKTTRSAAVEHLKRHSLGLARGSSEKTRESVSTVTRLRRYRIP